MVVIVGCGFLGQYVLKELLEKTEQTVLCTYHTAPPALSFDTRERVRFVRCNVTSQKDLQALATMCRGETLTVYYFAAFHNIDAVHHHPGAARAVNVEGLRRFLEMFPHVEKLFFASSDCVYGASKPGAAPFTETAVCHPVNEYGRQKLRAESLVLERGHYVLRFSLLYGASLCEKKTFYDTTFAALQAGGTVEMIEGLYRNALSYAQAARLLAAPAFVNSDLPHILNVGGERLLSKYALGCRIAAQAQAAPEQVIKITAEEGKRFFSDKRADCIALDTGRLQTLMNAWNHAHSQNERKKNDC